MRNALIAIAAVAAMSAAQAQVTMGSIGMWNTNNMLNRQIMDMANKPLFQRDALTRPAAAAAAPSATTFRPPAGIAAGAQAVRLADSYPAAHRAEAEQLFRQLLAGYHDIEHRFGIARNDVAGALAAFIAGAAMGYRDTGFPDEHFRPLVAQMRRALAANADFQRADDAEKQALYEQLAIAGMFMATTQMALQQRPDPETAASMRTAAKGYLEQFLKTDADRVTITGAGLVLR